MLNEAGVRTASVICDEPTELYQIDRDDFMDVCYEVYAAEVELKYLKAKSHGLFGYWEEKALRMLCTQASIMHFPYGKVIEEDWTRAEYIYFILEVGGHISLERLNAW